MAVTKEDILESISNMTVMEVVDLISDMEEKFGVTAAAPVAAAAAPSGEAGEAAEEKELVTTVVDWLQQTQEETYIHVAILAMLKGEHAMISEVDLHHLFLKAVYGLGFTDAAVTFANVSRRKIPNEAFKLQ